MLIRAFLCSLLLWPSLVPAEPEKPALKPAAELNGPSGADLPELPFKVSAPPEPPETVETIDLKKADPAELRSFVGQAMDAERPEDAYAFLYWALRRAPKGGEMQMLAQFSALRQKPDDAFYWLQRAVLEDACDLQDIAADRSFTTLAKDERWSKLLKYIPAVQEAWRKSGYHREAVVVPKGYKPGTPIPVFVALHGYGSLPEDFTSGSPADQALADELGVAMVSISATKSEGRNRFVWKENFEEDWEHIRKGLDNVKDRVTPQAGRCIALGFSQGGQLAAEIAAAHPEFFAGAIALSPGYNGKKRLDEALKAGGDKVSSQWYFVSWIQGESKDAAATSKEAEKLLTGAKARVITHAFPGETHLFPPGHMDYFAICAKVILTGK